MIQNQINFHIETNELKSQLSNLSRFCENKLDGIFDLKTRQKQITSEFDYNIINWIDNLGSCSLSECKLNSPIRYTFGFSDDQVNIRIDQLKRYGSDVNALSKIVTRISNLESQFRKIKIDSSTTRDIYSINSGGERFTQYTLAN